MAFSISTRIIRRSQQRPCHAFVCREGKKCLQRKEEEEEKTKRKAARMCRHSFFLALGEALLLPLLPLLSKEPDSRASRLRSRFQQHGTTWKVLVVCVCAFILRMLFIYNTRGTCHEIVLGYRVQIIIKKAFPFCPLPKLNLLCFQSVESLALAT